MLKEKWSSTTALSVQFLLLLESVIRPYLSGEKSFPRELL